MQHYWSLLRGELEDSAQLNYISLIINKIALLYQND